jgi:hypothetical protein
MSDHPLLRVRESTCDTWGQGTHICDSDALPKLEYLQWNRGERPRISGEWVPMGRECTVCEKVRKRQWPKGTAQSGLVEQCTNGDIDFRTKALRKDRVSGEMKPANDGVVGATHQSFQKDAAFNAADETGDFYPLLFSVRCSGSVLVVGLILAVGVWRWPLRSPCACRNSGQRMVAEHRQGKCRCQASTPDTDGRGSGRHVPGFTTVV